MTGKTGKNGLHSFAVRLMQDLVVATFVLDAERRVLIWNRACERLTGVPASRLLGTQDHWWAFYDTPRHCLSDIVALDRLDELNTLYAEHTAVSTTDTGLHAENWCTMPRLGHELYLAIDAGPIYDDHGKLIAVVETLRDMTEKKIAQQALQNLAERDGLTGIANRRAFDDTLRQEWLRAQRERHPLSLIMLDVDYFKRYNDRYGHQQGDECLRRVAGAIEAAALRPADRAARYGGEEFAVIMPNTPRAGAIAVAERIIEHVAALQLPHADSEVAERVTVSIGIATLLPQDDRDSDTLIAAADAALYAAKHDGRNRIVSSAAQ